MDDTQLDLLATYKPRVRVTRRVNTSKPEDTEGKVVRVDQSPGHTTLVYVKLDNGKTQPFLAGVIEVIP